MFKKIIVSIGILLFSTTLIYSTINTVKTNKKIEELNKESIILNMQIEYLKSQNLDLIENICYLDNQLNNQEKTKSNDNDNRWGITLTDNEKELLANIVMLEAGGEPDDGQEAVIEVVLNRIKHEDFPDNLYEVLSADGQFSTWKNRNISAAEPTEKVYKNIDLVLSGETDILPFETVYFGKQAHNKNVEKVIKNHVFCNDNK